MFCEHYVHPSVVKLMVKKKTKKEEYDFLVGIPSYNEADSISYVVKQVDEGIKKYFSEFKFKIVNVDNNSPDNTKKAFLETKTVNEKKYISTPKGIKGKGNNFYNLFKYAEKTNVKGVIVVDADLKSITPEWILKLGKPLLNNFDFVSPLYIRYKYDGTITNNLVFPIIYSLFNKNIRQPIGGDFSVSSKLIKYYLKQKWDDTTKQYGIDVFMTMNALVGGFSTTQVMLGTKIHKPSAPKLGPMFIQVVNTLFEIVITNKRIFKNQKTNKKPKKNYKFPKINPPRVEVNVNEIKKNSIKEFNEKRNFLKKNLNQKLFKKIEKAFTNNKVNITSKLWAEIVFEFMKKYEKSNNKIELIEAFKPLYWGRTYNFIIKTKKKDSIKAEKLIVKQAEIFWKKKQIYLKK